MLRPTESVPFAARREALPFQAEAVLATRELPYAALFHEQGLGKTKMALDLVLHWLSSGAVDSVMVVTKKALVPNWERETRLHTNLRPVVLSQDRRSNFFAFNRPGRLYLAHYEVMHSERGRLLLFAKARHLGMILDESQRIKNPGSKVAIALHSLGPLLARRIIMTGTPVANRPYDIWSQVYFLDGGESLGRSFSAFRSETDFKKKLGEDEGATADFEKRLGEVYGKIRHFAIRETKASTELGLPGKVIRNTPAYMESGQSILYHKFRRDLAAEVLRDGLTTWDDVEEILKRLLRLVQVASNPQLVDQGYEGVPGKFCVLDSIVGNVPSTGPKAIVWTSFTENVSRIAQRYPQMRPARVHGRLSIVDRTRDLDRFMEDPSCRLLVATPGSAKEGLTLTVANHAVFFDRTFSLDDYLQAQDRIHRISQTDECVVENIVAVGTIDNWVGELLSAKELAAALVQGDVSREEYREQATYAFNQLLQGILNPSED
ncbi:MAG: DEAD/DEAH box helicase [Chloroflexi bacterium]|nr:DEAD/DEAH box helicase [Chloroflexota bacterium]